MKFTRIAVVLFVLISSLIVAPRANAKLIPSPDGLTVYDTHLQVMWLADANLAGTSAGQFGVQNITPGGSMDYKAANQWVAALNGLNSGAGYLGHNSWQLPTMPNYDPNCSATGPLPYQNSFGYSCLNSDMGSLFYQSLSLQYPNTAVPIPDNRVGPFKNFQPYLYWSTIDSQNPTAGYRTFSFNTGWEGANVDKHYLYVLPMIEGNPFGTLFNGTGLQPSADGKTVYDPVADVTWLADADLAKTMKFGAQCIHPEDGTQCINPDGSMRHETAENWKDGMNAAAYLNQTNWHLPPTPDTDSTCSLPENSILKTFGFGCKSSPLGELFYNQLGLSQGTPVVPAPNINVGPFINIQPYLYWSSCEPLDGQSPCHDQNGNPASVPAPGFGWSFSFGNGFQGTDVQANDLYVMVYFPQTPAQALSEALTAALGTDHQLNAFLSQAADISSAPNDTAKAGRLGAFINHANAQRGKALTDAQANQLIALAQAV